MIEMASEEFIGVSGPKYEFPIELGKQQAFSAALHAFQPEFHEGKHPVMFPTLPTTAGYNWGYMLERPGDTPLADLELDNVTTLDAEQEFIFHGEKPRAGDTLIAQTSVDDIWVKQGERGGELTFYRTLTEFWDSETDEQKVSLYRTSVLPEKTDREITTNDTVYKPQEEPRDQFEVIKSADPETLEVGSTPGPVTMPPHTLTDCVRYQVTADNYLSVHHDSNAAQAEGYPTWFGVAMYHAGLLANYAVSWLPVQALKSFRTRFFDSTWPGDELTYRGEVDEVEEEGDTRLVKLVLSVERKGSTIIKGWATFSF